MLVTEAGLFKGVSQRTVNKIGSVSVDESYERGAQIIKAGEQADYFYVLAEGTVEISAGKRETIHFEIGRPGALIGLSALFEPFTYTTSASAKTDVKLIRIPREAIENVVRKYPEDGILILRHLMGFLAQRLKDVYANITSEAVLLRVP